MCLILLLSPSIISVISKCLLFLLPWCGLPVIFLYHPHIILSDDLKEISECLDFVVLLFKEVQDRLSLFFIRTWNFQRKGCGEMGLYVGLVVDEIGQELVNLLKLSASIKGADIKCLLIRRGYGGERCVCSFHFVVCFEYDLLLKQFHVAPYMCLRSLRNVLGHLHIPKSCQMLDSLST